MKNHHFFQPSVMGLLSPIQSFFQDPDISEIMINQPQFIWIERKGLFEQHAVPEFHEQHLVHMTHLLANETQVLLSKKQPVLSGNLSEGSRVQVVIPPVTQHYTWSIRRQIQKKMTLPNYQKNGFFDQINATNLDMKTLSLDDLQLRQQYQSKQWFQFLILAIRFKKNIIISGGTSSGKTTFLNACLNQFNQNTRLIILEDVREIVASHQNKVHMITQTNTIGAQNLQVLLQCALRLRPDRFVIGEIRGAEIADFIAACSTGHQGSLASIHANGAAVAFSRMVQLYKLNTVPSMSDQEILQLLYSVVDVIIQLERTSNGRKITEIWYRDIELNVD
ncbi:MAG: P-type DNA transfer ATPase VirB11 [Endozoicomonadaceae bacterium]|nr:P-type DNA transfer ATPase VirB11 [Endozoicomonadaceae bacterium]